MPRRWCGRWGDQRRYVSGGVGTMRVKPCPCVHRGTEPALGRKPDRDWDLHR